MPSRRQPKPQRRAPSLAPANIFKLLSLNHSAARMAEITACKENMSEKTDGSPAKKKIRTLDDAPNESHEKKGAAQLQRKKKEIKSTRTGSSPPPTL